MSFSGVMDKDGDIIRSYVYDDWNEYVIACILVKCYSGRLKYTPILSDVYKKTECKYEAIYNVLLEFKDFENFDASQERLKQFESDDDMYFIVHRLSRNIVYASDKVIKSLLMLTENFEDNPIKAYARFNVMCWYPEYIEIVKNIVNTYWIYAFSHDYHNMKLAETIPFDKIDVRKGLETICRYLDSPNFDRKNMNVLLECMEYKEKQLKEQHQKEIEELLAPGGAGYFAAKERFETNQKELDDELN